MVASLTGIIGYSSFLAWNLSNQYQRVLELAQTVGNIIGQDVAKIILLQDVSAAADITSSLKSFPGLESMVLYKLTEEAVYQYNQQDQTLPVDKLPPPQHREIQIKGGIARIYIDALYHNNHLGYAVLDFKITTISDMIQRDKYVLLIMALLSFALSYLLATFYAKRFTGPILQLVSFLEKIIYPEALRERISTREKNEYGKLYEEVNTMLERIEAAQEAQKLAAVAFETQSGMTITDANRTILKVNKAFTNISGYTSDEVIGKNPSILKSGLQDSTFYETMYRSLEEHHHWSGEIYNRHKDGTVYPEHLTIQAVLDDNEQPIYYVASFLDLTTQKESEAKLRYLEQYDPLTGLANRARLTKKIQQHLNDSEADGWGALICFDLKAFKLINEAHGHRFGDQILQLLSERIKGAFKDSDLMARIGADEFAIWFRLVENEHNKAITQSKILAEYLISELARPYVIQENTIHTAPVAGITVYEQHVTDADLLLKQADSALHRAKQESRSFAFFDEESERISRAHLDMYSQLHIAIKQEQFELYYQSQHDRYGNTHGMEGLIRWIHPQKGLISPLEFIPLAERTGQIVPIGLWVIQTACKQLAKWQQDPSTADWKVAINISPTQFIQDDFLSNVERTIQDTGIKPGSLKFELTESMLVDEIDKVIAKMNRLTEIGIELALDDFGTGYSSLQYLKDLPLTQVKIDQSFVRGMLNDKSDIAIVKSVLQLGESLQLEVMAEGVETEEHLALLKTFGCDLFQGYYFSRPQSAATLFTD